MIEIRHKVTGEVLWSTEDDTLEGVKITKAKLRGADLAGVSLCGADLSNLDLRDADLRETDFSDANLQATYFTSANASGAIFFRANLTDAKLINVNLEQARKAIAAGQAEARKNSWPVAIAVVDEAGELDLVARDGNVLAIVEVRYRASDRYGSAAASITRAKRGRIIRATRFLLATNPPLAKLPARFDVVEVSGPADDLRCELIKGAFSL